MTPKDQTPKPDKPDDDKAWVTPILLRLYAELRRVRALAREAERRKRGNDDTDTDRRA